LTVLDESLIGFDWVLGGVTGPFRYTNISKHLYKGGIMMKKWLRFGLMVISIFALIAVAGCGGGGDEPAAGESSGGEDQASQETILVASDTAYAPFEFQDPNSGDYVGFDMDLVKAIAEVNDWNCEIRSMNFDGIVPALESSSVDMSISAMTITDQRKEKVNFSVPYYRSGQSVMVAASNEDIKGFEDLDGKHIGAQISTTGAMEANTVPNAEVTEYNTINEAFMALRNGNIDAIVNDFPVNAYFIKQGNDDVKLVGDLRTSEHYGIAIPKDKPEILEKVNSALETLKENGKYDEIYKEWFGEEPVEYLPGEPTEQ